MNTTFPADVLQIAPNSLGNINIWVIFGLLAAEIPPPPNWARDPLRKPVSIHRNNLQAKVCFLFFIAQPRIESQYQHAERARTALTASQRKTQAIRGRSEPSSRETSATAASSSVVPNMHLLQDFGGRGPALGAKVLQRPNRPVMGCLVSRLRLHPRHFPYRPKFVIFC